MSEGGLQSSVSSQVEAKSKEEHSGKASFFPWNKKKKKNTPSHMFPHLCCKKGTSWKFP